MIPKIIHYCWFGNNEKTELVNKCIASWKKYCSDFEIVEWNEMNSPINSNLFASEALNEKKWAFVSDYIRLWALHKYGGVYLDTDVEILQPINEFLKQEAFLGYADDIYINPAMFGFEPENELCSKFLKYYDGRHFVLNNGQYDLTPNNVIYTKLCMKDIGFMPGDTHLSCGNAVIFPTRFFAPFKKNIVGSEKTQYSHENFSINEDTYAIHYATFSWHGKKDLIKMKVFMMQLLRWCLPQKMFMHLKKQIILRKLMKNIQCNR